MNRFQGDIPKETIDKMVNILRERGCQPVFYCGRCGAPLYVARVSPVAVEALQWEEATDGRIICDTCRSVEP